MTAFPDRLLVFVLISSYALTGTAGFGTHDHSAGPSDGNSPAFSAHGCGEREIHIPVEDSARCPICLSGLSRFAILTPCAMARFSAEVLLIVPSYSDPVSGCVDLFASGTRGPPLS
jgi:hypothetical protein